MHTLRVLTGVAALALSQISAAVTIDFEDSGAVAPAFSQLGGHYQQFGVVFGPAWTNYQYDRLYPASSGNLSALVQSSFAQGWIDFLTPAANVAAYFNVYSSPLLWSAFDDANNLLGSLIIGPTSQPTPGGMQRYAFAFDNISYLTLSGAQTNYFNMDDFSFETRPIPEPTTLTLIALGVLGFAFARRKR